MLHTLKYSQKRPLEKLFQIQHGNEKEISERSSLATKNRKKSSNKNNKSAQQQKLMMKIFYVSNKTAVHRAGRKTEILHSTQHQS